QLILCVSSTSLRPTILPASSTLSAPCLFFFFFFFFTLWRPPRHTLFPYTTLFRSVREEVAQVSRMSGSAVKPPGWSRWDSSNPSDRKSTRLNSSHVSISYAVFCLKKKNRMNLHKIHT